MKNQIRLLPKEQSDQGLHCLPFHFHLLDSHCMFTVKVTTLGVPKSLPTLFIFYSQKTPTSPTFWL